MSAKDKSKIYTIECFGETASFAESLGWIDTYGDLDSDPPWSAEDADAMEDECIEFIESKGYTVVWPEDEVNDDV